MMVVSAFPLHPLMSVASTVNFVVCCIGMFIVAPLASPKLFSSASCNAQLKMLVLGAATVSSTLVPIQLVFLSDAPIFTTGFS